MAKYIPPHRRADYNSKKLDISNHAKERMQQRDILPKTLEQTVSEGVTELDKSSITYRNVDSYCVVSPEGKVITTMANYRNTRFDMLNNTGDKEQKLLSKVRYGNDAAMCELAELYLNPALEKYDIKKAHDLLLKAASYRNSHAMCKLAKLYNSNLLGYKDPELYMKWMVKAADNGNKYATAIVGEHLLVEYYELPSDTSHERKSSIAYTAMRYLEKSAAKGSTRAMWTIACIYQTGSFGETNMSKAIDMFVEAAYRGSPGSLNSLNTLCKTGEFDKDKLDKILDKVSPIVAQNSSQIAVELSLAQIDGDLGSDRQKALKRGIAMLEKAARNRNEEAILALAGIYKEGTELITVDSEKSLFWFDKLRVMYEITAEKGNLESMRKLGELWLSGDLGKVDYHKALACLSAAAESGLPKYLYGLGIALIEDNSEIKNCEKGSALIRQAIEIWKKNDISVSMHYSIKKGNEYLASILIAHGADINKPDRDGASPLYCALGYYGQPINMRIIELLLENRADVNQPMDDGDTPMHMASYKSHIDAMQLLLSKGAKIKEAVNHEGKTPINAVIETEGYATSEQKIMAIKYLLDNGGEIGIGANLKVVTKLLTKIHDFSGSSEELQTNKELIDLIEQAEVALNSFSTDAPTQEENNITSLINQGSENMEQDTDVDNQPTTTDVDITGEINEII